ncbi:hypothetical protein UPYG_G00226090 [Umbra pygmaea]|uniref:Transcriptional-regulating factor 1-like n=1 Tax=Umbra pygmaea TaxID=75934 RepID=A0ABD0WHJ4_UMBPY
MSSQHRLLTDPEELLHCAPSPIHSPMSPQHCPRLPASLFSQTQFPFPRPLLSEAQLLAEPHGLVETDFSPKGVPSEVATCQLMSPPPHPRPQHQPLPPPQLSLHYGYQEYDQDQSGQQMENHPDPESRRDYPLSFQNHNRAYQPNLNHLLDPDQRHQINHNTNLDLGSPPNHYQNPPMDQQNPNSYQEPPMPNQTIYSTQEDHHVEQQSVEVLSQQLDPDHHQTIQNQQLRLQILAQLQREGLVYDLPEPPSQDPSHTQPHTHIPYTPTPHQTPSPYMYTPTHAGQHPSPCFYTQLPQSPTTPVDPISPWYQSPQSYPDSEPSYSPYPRSSSHPNFHSHPQPKCSTQPYLQPKYSPRHPNPTYSPHPNQSPYQYSHPSPHSHQPSPSSTSPYAYPNTQPQSSHNYALPSTYPNHNLYSNTSPSPVHLSPPPGGWGSGRGVSPESRRPHLNQLSLFRHLNNARPLCSPPAQLTKGTLAEHMENDETSNGSRLLCSVCQRVFRSLPALNGHLRSHGGLRGQNGRMQTHRMEGVMPVSPAPLVMPVSVPIRPPDSPAPTLEEDCREGEQDGRREWKNKRCQRRPSPLVLPCKSVGAVVFQSVLRPTGASGAYTPAPMLRPAREGTGLFCSLTGGDGGLLTPMEQPIKIKPKINVGVGFQAEVPSLQDQRHAHSDPHNALLLWTPWDDLENPSTQHRVESLLMMSCSSVCPGGGTNSEYALHSLSKSKGDFLITLEKMLLQQWPVRHSNSSTPYHYAGSDRWSPLEKRLVNKAFRMYKKDFHQIHLMVGTKSVSQCVEYYYTWKKRLRLNVRPPVGLAITLPEGYLTTPSGLPSKLLEGNVRTQFGLHSTLPEGDMRTMVEVPSALPEGNSRTPVGLSSTLPEDNSVIMDGVGLEVNGCPTNKELSITKSPDLPRPTANSFVSPVIAGYNDGQVCLTQPSLNVQMVLHAPSTQNACQQIRVGPFSPLLLPGSGGCSPVQREVEWLHRTHCTGSDYLKTSPSLPGSNPRPNPSLHPFCSKPHPQPTTLYPCRECTKVFSKVKSRNAHMKTHRQQDGHTEMEELHCF